MARERLAACLALMLSHATTACGTDAVGVQACRQVQGARCRQASSCGISLEPPYHTSGTDVDACIRYYDDVCLHGLASSDPGPARVNACVDAINNAPTMDGGCAVVNNPEQVGECSWLVPPSMPDASSDRVLDSSNE
jgi:hypothetical protein